MSSNSQMSSIYDHRYSFTILQNFFYFRLNTCRSQNWFKRLEYEYTYSHSYGNVLLKP